MEREYKENLDICWQLVDRWIQEEHTAILLGGITELEWKQFFFLFDITFPSPSNIEQIIYDEREVARIIFILRERLETMMRWINGNTSPTMMSKRAQYSTWLLLHGYI